MSCVIFPRSIGPVFIDVVVSEEGEASMEIPSHPVEKGAKISDHAWRLPKTLKMECLSQDMTGTWGSLNDLMEQAEPFDVLSGFDLFENMMIESIEAKRDVTWAQVLSHTVTLKEVIIVGAQGFGGGVGSIGSFVGSALGSSIGLSGDARGLGMAVRGQIQALEVDVATTAGRLLAGQIPPLLQ